ncbi:selenoprotein F [Pimephales promelas]|nr:selenoprotein F [Pimephales promelas]
MAGEVYLFWLLPLLQTLSSYGAELSSEACRELGFSSNLLAAKRRLSWSLGSSTQEPSLRSVDENWGGSLKSKVAFVRSDKPKMFKGLQIKYVRGSDPVLKLLDDNGNIADELSILKWNTDSVEEFLSEKLDRI